MWSSDLKLNGEKILVTVLKSLIFCLMYFLHAGDKKRPLFIIKSSDIICIFKNRSQLLIVSNCKFQL